VFSVKNLEVDAYGLGFMVYGFGWRVGATT